MSFFCSFSSKSSSSSSSSSYSLPPLNPTHPLTSNSSQIPFHTLTPHHFLTSLKPYSHHYPIKPPHSLTLTYSLCTGMQMYLVWCSKFLAVDSFMHSFIPCSFHSFFCFTCSSNCLFLSQISPFSSSSETALKVETTGALPPLPKIS